jgi:D-glycero-alpha-D-manno-heptose 1-phosphate guanylyltransferase
MRSLADTMAVILAGGLGTRLRSVVADRPKVLAEVAGRPFITHLLDQLHAAGSRHVVLCTGYLGEQVEAAIGPTYRGMRVGYSREAEPLGTGGALRLALEHVDSPDLLVLNGDSYCAADLEAFAAWHARIGSQASLFLAHIVDTDRYGSVVLGPGERVERFQEKAGSSGPGWINAGIYLLNRDLLADVPTGATVSLERDLFPRWGLHGFRAEAAFIDIGVPTDYARAATFLRDLAPAA